MSNFPIRQARTLCACQQREQVTSGYRPKFSYDFGKLLIIRRELDDLRTKEWVQHISDWLPFCIKGKKNLSVPFPQVEIL